MQFFSHKEDSQNIVIFSASDVQKKRRKFDPLRDGSDAMIRISICGKETCIRKDSQKKFIFWGDFSKYKLRENEFSKLFVI